MKEEDCKTTNCPNCGAPLNADGYCEYCGTKRQHESEIVMTATELRFICR